MRRILTAAFALSFATVAVACGGGEQAAQDEMGKEKAAAEKAGKEMAAAGEMTVPSWMQVDEEARTVTMDVVSGSTDANNSWNYNGYHSGNARITVPQGYEITINFSNEDDLSPHSLGIDAMTSGFPATFTEVTPAFEGAVTSNATNMSNATQPGQSETISFTASEPGEYSMICYLPGHATAGMWIYFNVSSDGSYGLQEL